MILGMKVRKHDLHDLLKFNPKILEFHFSDSDLGLQLQSNFDMKLMVHCYEYYNKKLLDIASLGETNQIHSQETTIELIQKAIDKTILLNEQFIGTPSLIVHPGGYSLNELSSEDIEIMKGKMVDGVKKLDIKNINFLMENMPPFAWFFGGRWNSNVFLSADDMITYCNKTGFKICYDLCHSQLYCNKIDIDIIDELNKIGKYVDHFHLSDADGVDEEGLQLGEGTMNYDKIIPILNNFTEKSFAIEVWKGHEQCGKGFGEFLDKIKQQGLIVN